jgi:protease YdgD
MRFALIAALLVQTLPALAQESPLVSLQTGDDLKGWNAVGRLNLGKHGFCSGALIAPDLVLTAAHCLYDKTTGAKIDPRDIEFLAGLRNGRAEAYRGAVRAVAHPEYIYTGSSELDRVGFDVALIQLDQPIRQPNVIPFATGDGLQIGSAIGVVSYAQDRAEAPSLQRQCHVMDASATVVVMTCNIDFGSSGAPVFALQDGVEKIVSVISSKADAKGQKVSLGAQLTAPLQVVMAEMAKQSGPVATAGARVSTLKGGKSSGAKFIKP